jgi:hypothetical protein
MADPVVVDGGQTTRLAISLCDRLGLDDALGASRRLLQREQDLGEVVRREQMQARGRRGKELQRLVTGTAPVAVMVVQATLAETDPWLNMSIAADASSAQPAPAVALLREAARVCRGHAAAAAVADGPGLYQRLQELAASCVTATAAATALPKRVWTAPDPATEAMRDGHEAGWATLVRAQDRFSLTHQLGALVRAMGSLGAAALPPGGAPGWAFVYRQWKRVDEQQLKPLHPGLRLRYACDNHWGPGLWLAEDLVLPEPEPDTRRGLRGWLIPSPLRSG